MKLAITAGLASVLLSSAGLAQTPAASANLDRTITGIPLNAPWKERLYAFARAELKHPAWGWTHSERDYRLAVEIASREKMGIDLDVLFAAAFTHDMGAIGTYQKGGVDHAVRSGEIAEPLLLEYGFPASKLPQVKEAILGHMHDKQPGKSNEAIALHDADTVDFLGTIGIARRLSVTGEATDYSSGVDRIREFADKLPGRLVTNAAKAMAKPRVAEMKLFLASLGEETEDDRLH